MSRSLGQIRRLLDSDRIWSAYALADLDPRRVSATTWHINDDAAFLIYAGFDPAVLFSIGSEGALRVLLPSIPTGRYTYTILKNSRDLLDPLLTVEHEEIMSRMVLDNASLPKIDMTGLKKLNGADLGDVHNLFDRYPDHPDSFAESQLQDGFFFGTYQRNELVSIAGTHVVSKAAGVAAIGNVFTEPQSRNRGLATKASIRVAQMLREAGIETIVLNVARNNRPALTIYKKIGFRHYCEYYEGQGELQIGAF